MSTTIPALNDVSDILDSDLCIVTHSNGDSYKISGAEINKRNQAIIAPDATPLMLTGAPLKTSNIIRVYWKVDLTSANGATALALSYNNVSYNVKVPRNGALASFLPFNLGNGVYKYLQAYTTLEVLYDGTQFILLGNPVLISTANYTYTADGKGILDTVSSGNMHSVTSNAVEGAIAPVSNCVFEFPIATHFMSTTSTTYTQYFIIGNNFKAIYDSYPNQINGKTKKLKLAFCLRTASSNTIDVAMKRQSDQNYVEIMNDIQIWGGIDPEGYGSVIEVGVDPSFIDHHTYIYFKDSDGQGVAIAYCFGRVNYE